MHAAFTRTLSSLLSICGTVAVRWADRQVRHRLVIVLAGLLFCCYALWVFLYVLGLPEIGLHTAFSAVVNRVDPGFVYAPPGEPLPEVAGSRIVRIGDRSIETWPQVLRALVDLKGQEDQATPVETLAGTAPQVLYQGERLIRVELTRPDGDGSAYAVWCRVGRLPLELLVPSLLWFFLKAGLFLVAAAVYWNRPGDLPARQFFVLSLLTFGAYIGGYHWSRVATQPALLLVFMLCSVLLPAASLHFYLVFPRPKEFLQRRPSASLAAIYGLPVAFLAAFVLAYGVLRWLFQVDPRYENVAPVVESLLGVLLTGIKVYFAIAALWYLASIICLVHSFRSTGDVTERNQVKWILYGLLASLVPIGYTLYLAFLRPQDFGGGGATWPMFLASVCVTAAFTVSITRYRLMQLDEIVTSGMVYFLISFLGGGIYYAVVFAGTLLSSQWNPTSLGQAVAVSTAVLVLLLGLDWLRGRVKRALDRRFSREKRQLDRTLRQLSQAIDQLIDPPVLSRRLLQASAELLGVSRGSVYLREGDSTLYRLADALGPVPPLTELPAEAPLVQAVQTNGVLLCRQLGPAASHPAEQQLHKLGGDLAQPLVHEGQVLALLVLGPKNLGWYTAEDLNLIAAFAQFTALALESARGHQAIEALNRELQAKVEKISEQQRRILALQSQLMLQKKSVVRQPPPAPTAPAPAAVLEGNGQQAADDGKRTTDIVGSSLTVRRLLREVRKVAESDAVVLIRGESGTGKELLAHALHEHSPRAGRPFVKVHCAALSPGLLESELFGHVKGAFTGAHRDKIGRFELAHGGTLFLDEIGDISLEVQTKLLRVLQERTFERVGSSEPVQVDVRVIAATHQHLESLIHHGRFREDLYYRLNVISLTVPALRDRREDIPELALHFLRHYAERSGKAVAQIDDDALATLKAFSWPGNIRQLENVIERAVVVAEGPVVTLEELPPELLQAVGDALVVGDTTQPETSVPRGVAAERAERDLKERERLVRALAGARGNKAEAARALGLARSTFLSRLRKHGLG